MSRQKRIFFDQFNWHMLRAINLGYAEGVDMLLQSAVPYNPSPQMLGPFVHKVLHAPSFAELTDFKTHGHRRDAEFMPKRAWDYEMNLRKIVELLGQYGADMTSLGRNGEIAAQNAFHGTTKQMQPRWPTCFAVVSQTLMQHPNWLPDFEKPFRALDALPSDADAAQKRAGLADHIGALGCEIGQWLKHHSEPGEIRDASKIKHAPLTGDMLAANRSFWMRDYWVIDAASMPWGDADKINAARSSVDAKFFEVSSRDSSRVDITGPVTTIIARAKAGKFPPPQA